MKSPDRSQQAVRGLTPAKSTTTAAEVARQIRQLVLDGSLSVGTKLPPERQLAEQLSVGRNAVREALRSLEMRGMVVVRAGKGGGSFVSDSGIDSVSEQMTDLLILQAISLEDLTEARISMSRIVVPAACEHRDEQHLAAMRDNIARVETLFAEGRLMQKTLTNIEFHNLLAAATGNPIYKVMMRPLTDMAKHVARTVGPDSSSVTVRSRRLFLSALQRRDADAACAEMEASLRRLQSVQLALASNVSLRPSASVAASTTKSKSA